MRPPYPQRSSLMLRVLLPLVLTLSCAACAPIAGPASDASRGPAGEVWIPAGPFQMGCSPDDGQCNSDESPLHQVTLDAYFIDTYEVTNARYATCVDAGACTPPRDVSSATRNPYYGSAEFADYPVINVDWNQADTFCRWEGKRLPTEAEWEKAARGSDDTGIHPWGDEAPTCDLLNLNTSDPYVGYDEANHCVGDTAAVGSYPAGASPYGVMDMSGNVWEWVADWYDGGYYGSSPGGNPAGPDSGDYRVLRGGSWLNSAGFVRVSYRLRDFPDVWNFNFGFRCARSQ